MTTATGRIVSCELLESTPDIGPVFRIKVELDYEHWLGGPRTIELRTDHGTLPNKGRFPRWCTSVDMIKGFLAVGKFIEFEMSAVQRRARRAGEYESHHRATDFGKIRSKRIDQPSGLAAVEPEADRMRAAGGRR